MKLAHEFIQLAHNFNVQQLQKEVKGIPDSAWVPHHEGFKGNYSIPLVSVDGKINNDFKGAMAPTEILNSCPYLQQVIASFGEVVGRSRLMALGPGCQVPKHSDINYHWYKRIRIHIPIITDPKVIFHCADKQVHMQAGEAWIFDSWKYHQVHNDSDLLRIHLVIDICGSPHFWEQAKFGKVPWLQETQTSTTPKFIDYVEGKQVNILCEKFNVPLVMSPGEVDGLVGDLLRDLKSVSSNKPEHQNEFIRKVEDFAYAWRCLWIQHGLNESGWKAYHELRQSAFESVKHLDAKLYLQNDTQAVRMFLNCIIDPALNVEVKDSYLSPAQQSNTNQVTRPKAPAPKPMPNAAKPSKPPSRNEPCFCGSGLKYKACHGKLR